MEAQDYIKQDDTCHQKDVMIVPDHELTRKRDILITVSLCEGLKNYVGENISAANLRKMKKEKLENYFKIYKEKVGQESVNDMMSSLADMAVYGLSFVGEIDDEKDLKDELLNNKQLRRSIGKQVSDISENYGDGVSILKVLFTIVKHVSFSFMPAPASTMPAPASTMPAPASTMPAPASTMPAPASTMPAPASIN